MWYSPRPKSVISHPRPQSTISEMSPSGFVQSAGGRQTMHISRADVEVAACLEVPVGEPMADVRRVLAASDGTVLYLAEVSYRGDYIHLDMVLKP